MSWDCPVFPIDAKNSIGFLVQFFLSYAPLVGDSVYALWNPVNHVSTIENEIGKPGNPLENTKRLKLQTNQTSTYILLYENRILFNS